MKTWVSPQADVSYLDEIIFDEKGLVRVLPYSVYAPNAHLAY